ncbi:hypothetical protein TNCV_5088411 [Trichonephila clavipes]|nr:hypothetical protein TNCV_5088411 [Trichonephila clavipes]
MQDPRRHGPDVIFSSPLSALSSRNRESSLHATRFQSTTLQSLGSLALARRAAQWRALRNGTLLGRRLQKPVRRSERCSVRLLTVRLPLLFNWVAN